MHQLDQKISNDDTLVLLEQQCKFQEADDIGFDVFTKTDEQLEWFTLKMFDDLGLLWHFRIGPETMRNFFPE